MTDSPKFRADTLALTRGCGGWGVRGHWADDAGVILEILSPEYQ